MDLQFPTDWPWGLLWIILAAGASVLARKMDLPGALTGIAIALGLYLGGGYPQLGLLVIFFVLGVGASVWGRKRKESLGLAQEAGGKRSVRHAFANGGVAGIAGWIAWLWPETALIGSLVMAGSLASALGDTWSSELGNLYGRRYFDLRTRQMGQRGLDGVISLEGTLIGFLGSGIMGAYYWAMTGHLAASLWISLAGCLGNLMDSLLGARLQRSNRLNNDQVNFLSTLFAAIVAGLGFWI